MSLKTLLLPIISRRLFSRERLLHKRAKAEQKRVKAQAPHQLHYFHQVDDPYIELGPHVVSAPPDAAAPERDKLVAYSRVDAEQLARHHGLSFRDPGRQPSATALAEATALLVGTLDPQRFAALAGPLMANLWQLKLDLRDGIAHRAVHLRDATQRVAVLRLVFLAAAERLEALIEFFTAVPLVQGHPIPGDVESQRIKSGFRPTAGQPGTEFRHQMVGDIHQT